MRQVKYVYDCVKPSLASPNSRAGRVNASARNSTSGSSFFASPISHAQKFGGLVCGLSTRNTLTPCEIQNRTTRSTSG